MNAAQNNELIEALKDRFEKNMKRHDGIAWDAVEKRLISQTQKLEVLHEMECTGGEPDVIAYDQKTGEVTFCDCSPESPAGRRSLCYDQDALASRKEHKPRGNAIEIAAAMGIDMLTETQYRQLQKIGEFDRKTSSWIQTPPDIRKLGGALFCDRRYGHVFVYHNGAESYYAARGFRGLLIV